MSQNIDSLERLAGVEESKLTEAHGTFHLSHCLNCQKEYSQDWIKGTWFSTLPMLMSMNLTCCHADCHVPDSGGQKYVNACASL